MSVERWRMPSGRVATIDLHQAPEAIEDARNLLREFGDAVLIEDEDAPGAGGNQPEGNKTNSEGKDPVTSVSRRDVDQFAQEIGATIFHERGLSLDWLADEIKIGNVQAVADAILGTQHIGSVFAIAEALAMTPSELMQHGGITEFRKTERFRRLLAEYEASKRQDVNR